MTFDGREILVHEVPLPSLGRIRRLQPAAGRHRPREPDISGLRVRRSGHCRGNRTPDVSVAAVCQRETQGSGHVHQNLPIFARFTGWSNGLRSTLHQPHVVGIQRVFFHVGGARENEIGRRCQFRHHHALYDEERQLAAALCCDHPRHIANRSIRSGIKHVQRFDASSLNCGSQLREVGQAVVAAANPITKILCAVDVGGVGRWHPEFCIGRLWLLAPRPRDEDRRQAIAA